MSKFVKFWQITPVFFSFLMQSLTVMLPEGYLARILNVASNLFDALLLFVRNHCFPELYMFETNTRFECLQGVTSLHGYARKSKVLVN